MPATPAWACCPTTSRRRTGGGGWPGAGATGRAGASTSRPSQNWTLRVWMSPTTSTPRTSSPSSSHRPVFSSRDARRSAMAAQPEQIGLPALVALVYRADWTRLRLSGTVYTRHDLALRNRMSQVQATGEPLPGLFGRWLRSAQSGQPQSGQPQSGPDPEPDGVTGGRVLFAPGGHYRIELTHEDGPGLTVCDGESRWDVRGDVAD